MSSAGWDARAYDESFRFVSDHAGDLVALLDPIEMRGHLLRRELLDGPHQQAFLRPHVVRNDDFVG